MVPRVSKPEAGGFTLKGRVSSQHGRSCQHLPLPSGMVPESLPFYALGERRWLQAGWMFKVTTGKLWTSAFSRLPIGCPMSQPTSWSGGHNRHAELGPADQNKGIGSVNTGDLRHAERRHATVTTARSSFPRFS